MLEYITDMSTAEIFVDSANPLDMELVRDKWKALRAAYQKYLEFVSMMTSDSPGVLKHDTDATYPKRVQFTLRRNKYSNKYSRISFEGCQAVAVRLYLSAITRDGTG